MRVVLRPKQRDLTVGMNRRAFVDFSSPRKSERGFEPLIIYVYCVIQIIKIIRVAGGFVRYAIVCAANNYYVHSTRRVNIIVPHTTARVRYT